MKVQHADAVQALKDSGTNVVLVCVVDTSGWSGNVLICHNMYLSH